MKTRISNKPRPTRLIGVVLLGMAASLAAQTPAPLNGRLISRPLTPNNVATYAIPTTEYAGGLSTVGVGTPVYLEADVNIAIPASDVTNVSFALTSAPIGSGAKITNSPFGTNVGVYEPSDQLVYQAAARALLRPDLTGQYTVTATIGSISEGTTNVSYTFTAGKYLGVYTCELCHSGGLIAQEEYQYWTNTAHSMIFTEGIDGVLGNHYSTSCLQCHTVGYDTNAASLADGGFYATSLSDGWKFPTVLTNGNFAAMPANLQNLGNIQCENCHGPGSEHFAGAGDTNKITATVLSGACNQCHDDPTHHYYGTEWYASKHAITTTDPAGSAGCVGCHTAYGFIARIQNTSATNQTSYVPTNTAYAAIGCQTCHEPHGNGFPTGNAHLVRTLTPVTLMDGTVVTNAGEGVLCMECHHARQKAATYAATSSGSSHFGPHEGPQADMIEGVNGFTYGLAIPSSAHANAVSNTCVTCHMQAIGATDPSFLKAGGHTFEIGWSNATNSVDLVGACQNCHGPAITSFDFPLQDYDGNGVIEGVQTEIQNLLNKLALVLPPVGQPKTSLNIDSTWTRPQLEAAYNWLFVNNDGSKGIHNTAYAAGLLKASIANLTGTSVPGGLPDAWEIEYFGSTTNANGAPNADPAGDGIPNWLKYALGLNPLQAGLSVSNGVVYANGTALGGNGGTNTIQIYTAAEVSFDTMAGSTYQIQEVSSLSGGWQNVGTPIVVTNSGSMSYLTPTRTDVQQYFRVMHTP